MNSIKQILENRKKTTEDKHLSREFQKFGYDLAEKLGDISKKSLYIKLAKTEKRELLIEAFTFAVDSGAKNRGALFMWKLKQLKNQKT